MNCPETALGRSIIVDWPIESKDILFLNFTSSGHVRLSETQVAPHREAIQKALASSIRRRAYCFRYR